MPRRRHGNDHRAEGEDLAVARHRWYWSRALRRGPGPPEGWEDATYAPPELLAQAHAEPPASTHDGGCWCPRCGAAARALGAWPRR